MSPHRSGWVFLVLAIGTGCAAPGRPPAGPHRLPPRPVSVASTPVCHDCFWTHLPPGQRAEAIAVLGARTPADPLVLADVRLMTARIAGDAAAACAARAAFAELAGAERDPPRRLLASETVAFMAAECGDAPAPRFREAAAAARAAAQDWKAGVYEQLAAGTFRPRWSLAEVRRELRVPAGATGYVLGASAIRVSAADTIVTQVERIARDWLSYQYDHDFRRNFAGGTALDYHEGARVRDLHAAGAGNVRVASGTLAIQVGTRWYAPDGDGVFRFAVLPDKVQYPTTRAWNGVALLVDTHGIAPLVEPALRLGARLVIGCGDDAGKVAAAFALAESGRNVYLPTDDFAAELIGYVAPGVIVGSAPVRPHPEGGALIGDRPVAFAFDEPIVVQRAPELHGALRYYGAPARYFERLAEVLPLRVEYVDVDDAGQAARITARAAAIGARAIALRVWNEADGDAVRAWLAASPDHRAVLLHSVVYPAGHRLFEEFPRQTTFADARPVFTPAR
ncbi:MAG TPA: hypothetical protein VK939_13025 [Longimicrobiales bacterium]|nr:hypothetical protein [Longimicrobiales bacterium]